MFLSFHEQYIHGHGHYESFQGLLYHVQYNLTSYIKQQQGMTLRNIQKSHKDEMRSCFVSNQKRHYINIIGMVSDIPVRKAQTKPFSG